MGHTLEHLSEGQISEKTIFNNRFVVEICEKVHVHYRNLRILLSLKDWSELAQGMFKSYERWLKLGSPEPSKGVHIELCRKEVGIDPQDRNLIRVNLNKNLYPEHEGKIFADGADFHEEKYIHLKIRDLRLELSNEEFLSLAKVVREAEEKLCQSVSQS